MTPSPQAKDYAALVRALSRPDGESEWVEFKKDFANPKDIGQYISALANSAVLSRQPFGYILWGVEDRTGKLVGTKFNPHNAKKGNESLENWLLRLLEPKIHFSFHTVDVDGIRIVLAEIEQARNKPVQFEGVRHIRIGSVTKPLGQLSEKERALWRAFDQTPFEQRSINGVGMNAGRVVQALDTLTYFKLLQLPAMQDPLLISKALLSDGMLESNLSDNWNITNKGAILLADDLRHFPNLQRKAVRVIQYAGKSRVEAAHEQVFHRGYAVGFDQLIDYIRTLIPTQEVFGTALRKDTPKFPIVAVRELVANMLVHQEFAATGAGPMVEIFSDRIEITNPGESLIEPARLIDAPPQTRNEAIASFMRRAGLCEERGTGIDKAMEAIELAQLPAPLFETPPGATRVTIFARQDFKSMTRADKIRAVYQHACLCYVMRKKTTNATLRDRFGVSSANSAIVSRILRDALKVGVIILKDETAGPRNRAYLPYWAAPAANGTGKFI